MSATLRPAVEAVIVSYRSAAALPACLAALRPFVGDDGRITLVDNCPGDGSAEVALAAAPGLRVVTSPGNVGFGAANNSAMRTSNADVFLLVNPDCRVRSGELESVLRVFREDPRAAAVGTLMVDICGDVTRNYKRSPGPYDYLLYAISADKRFPWWRHPSRMRLSDMDYAVEQPVESLSGAFMFLRREAVEDVGGFDERFFLYCEETDWCKRAAARGWHCVHTPAVVVEHDGGGSSDTPLAGLRPVMLQSQLRYVRKHYGVLPAVVDAAALLALDLARLARGLASGEAGRTKVRDARARIAVYGSALRGLSDERAGR